MFSRKFICVMIVLISFSLISCSYATDDYNFEDSTNISSSNSDDYVVYSSDELCSSHNSSSVCGVNDVSSSVDLNNLCAMDNVTNRAKFVGKDVIVHEGSSDNFSISLINANNSAIVSANVIVKVLDYDFNLLKDYNLVTNNDGFVKIPCSFSNGIYFVSYEFLGNMVYSSAYGMNKIEVIPYKWGNTFVDFKIPTYVLVDDTNIFQKGDVFKGRLVDYYNNPLSGKKIDLIVCGDLNSYNGITTVKTDDDGYFYLSINKPVGIYDICCRYVGDKEYEYSQTLISLNVSYMPNMVYLVNLTNDGREIGIYKNNKLYKYCYSCSVSDATKLDNNVLYFVSLDSSFYSLQKLSSSSQIKSSGISLYCNGKNVLITYYGYTGTGLGNFNVIFDGKTSGSNHICNLSLYYKDNLVACLYFSSEKNVNSYAPIFTNFTVFNKKYNMNNIFYLDSISQENWENLYYGDISYNNPLKKAGWNSKLGYESVQSYLVCEDEITDDIMNAYLSNASKFSGVRKVVYDNFLTALTYQWLADKLANELADEYHVGWAKLGYPLVSSFTGVNGRFISVHYTTSVVSGLDFDRFNKMYGLYGSLLEEYVMSLTGSNSTCSVSEVFKGLLNGEEFYYYYDSENLCTVLKLADNSSWLEFSDFGYINSIINRTDLQNKYNGGMCLGDFNYNNVGFQLFGELVDLLNLRSSLSVIRTLCNQLYETIKDLPGGEVIAPYAANLILGLFGSDVFWYGIGIISATGISITSPEFLMGFTAASVGVGLVFTSNGLFDKSYSNTETFVFSLLDLGTAGLLGKGIDAVCKFGLSGGSKSVYEGIHVFLLSSINESIKEISKFYQNI